MSWGEVVGNPKELRPDTKLHSARVGFAAALVCCWLACFFTPGWALNELGGGASSGSGADPAPFIQILEGPLWWGELYLAPGAAGQASFDFLSLLGSGASLTSRHQSNRNSKFEDKNWGLTTSETTHALSFNLGPGSQVTASLADQLEEWDPQLARARLAPQPGANRRTRSLELKSALGPTASPMASLLLALSSGETNKGGQRQWERKREAQLELTPSRWLRLNAEYLAKASQQDREETTKSFGAILELAPEAQLAAGLKTVALENGPDAQESSLSLRARLGNGATAGRLEAEEKVTRSDQAARTKQRKWTLTSALGRGVNLRAALEEKRGEGPEGALARTTVLHLDRAWGPHLGDEPRLKISAERQEKVAGTNAAPETTAKSSCEVAAQLGARTRLDVTVASEQKPREVVGDMRRIVLGQEWGKLRFRAEEQLSAEGQGRRSELAYVVEARSGDLPKWAEGIPGGHEFPDAPEYLLAQRPTWERLNMPFAGFRLWTRQRRGGQYDGLHTFGVGGRGILARRYHLQLAYQQCPEAESGEAKGRPMPVQRGLLEIGTPISKGLTVRAGYQTETSLTTPGLRRRGVALGVWGPLSERERVEVSVSHDRGASFASGRWEDGAQAANRVSLLYSLRVNEEHQISLKVGYGWRERDAGGPQASPDRERESRVSLGYEKPI